MFSDFLAARGLHQSQGLLLEQSDSSGSGCIGLEPPFDVSVACFGRSCKHDTNFSGYAHMHTNQMGAPDKSNLYCSSCLVYFMASLWR